MYLCTSIANACTPWDPLKIPRQVGASLGNLVEFDQSDKGHVEHMTSTYHEAGPRLRLVENGKTARTDSIHRRIGE